MKIKISSGANQLFLAYNVRDAGLFLMANYRHTVEQYMGRMTVSRVIEYGRAAGVKVEKVDHTVHWVELSEAEKKKE